MKGQKTTQRTREIRERSSQNQVMEIEMRKARKMIRKLKNKKNELWPDRKGDRANLCWI